MAIIGRNAAAVNAFGHIRFTGFPAWFFWLALHVFYLPGLRNQTMVSLNWIYNYFFGAQQIRIIIGGASEEEKALLQRSDAQPG